MALKNSLKPQFPSSWLWLMSLTQALTAGAQLGLTKFLPEN